MFTKGVVDEDFVNYKVPSMFINSCFCTFKCDEECGMQVCQNSNLAAVPIMKIDNDALIDRFLRNPITRAVVIGGLEPMDSLGDLLDFIEALNRHEVKADLVIYSGYNEGEIGGVVDHLYYKCRPYRDLIIKFGRYIPNDKPIFDPVLGVNLASANQHARRYPRHQINV